MVADDAAVLLDALHIQRGGSSIADVRALEPSLVPCLQICDGPLATPESLELPAQLPLGMTADGSVLQVEARALREVPGEKIFFLQLADAPHLAMDVLPWSRHHRLFPGQGDFDLTALVGHLDAAGYDGPWSLEVFNDVFRQADPRPAAVDAHAD